MESNLSSYTLKTAAKPNFIVIESKVGEVFWAGTRPAPTGVHVFSGFTINRFLSYGKGL